MSYHIYEDNGRWMSVSQLMDSPVWHAFVLGHGFEDDDEDDVEALEVFAEYICPLHISRATLSYLDEEWNRCVESAVI